MRYLLALAQRINHFLTMLPEHRLASEALAEVTHGPGVNA
jgi:hypothetical protein